MITLGQEDRSSTGSDAHVLEVQRTTDFEVSGEGRAKQWERTAWIEIPQRVTEDARLATRAKVLYSKSGVYFLFDCEDRKITATLTEDFADLYNEDVVEVFLWPEEEFPVYFEYEISPLGYELPIIVPNNKGDFLGWRPWHYEGERRVRKATAVRGGDQTSGAAIDAWTAEFFIPFALLKPLGKTPPGPGTRWRANLYRLDYDTGRPERWTWRPVGPSFHEYEKFGTFLFQ